MIKLVLLVGIPFVLATEKEQMNSAFTEIKNSMGASAKTLGTIDEFLRNLMASMGNQNQNQNQNQSGPGFFRSADPFQPGRRDEDSNDLRKVLEYLYPVAVGVRRCGTCCTCRKNRPCAATALLDIDRALAVLEGNEISNGGSFFNERYTAHADPLYRFLSVRDTKVKLAITMLIDSIMPYLCSFCGTCNSLKRSQSYSIYALGKKLQGYFNSSTAQGPGFNMLDFFRVANDSAQRGDGRIDAILGNMASMAGMARTDDGSIASALFPGAGIPEKCMKGICPKSGQVSPEDISSETLRLLQNLLANSGTPSKSCQKQKEEKKEETVEEFRYGLRE